MKAVIYTEFGPPEVLHVADVPAPAPQEGEVLVRVHAASVSYGDLLARNFKAVTSREFNMPLPLLFPMRLVFGLRKPRVNILASESAESLVFVSDLAEAGKFKTAIDRCFPLEQAAEAHRYVESGRIQGAVVLTMDPLNADPMLAMRA